MAIDLYYAPGSAPCHIVMLVAAALNIDLNLNSFNLLKGDHLTPEFLKLNPQHTVPTIVDNGFSLWESRAISRYLINKYTDGDHTLYPKDPKTRAVIDQRVDFDLGTLYPRFAQYYYPQIFYKATADEEKLKSVRDALVFLNTFLEGRTYAAADHLTLADLSLVATVSSMEYAGISVEEYPNINRWYKLVQKTAPKFEEVAIKGLKQFQEVINNLKKTEL